DLAELSPFQRRHLEQGHPLVPGEGYGRREDFEAAWRLHGEGLLEEWIEAHPGTRPFAWWLLDHGKERPVVAPWATTEEVRRPRAEPGRFHFLHTEVYSGRRPDGRLQPLQEPEDEYLERLGLLGEDELAQVCEQRAAEIAEWERTWTVLKRPG